MRFLPLILLACASVSPASQGGYTPGRALNIEDVTKDDLAPVQKKFDELVAAGATEITFRINSFGGDVFAGMSFVQHVEQAKKVHALRIRCIVDHTAYSMGFVFLQSFCDDRLMTKRSTLLAHNASGGVRGNANDMEQSAEFLRALDFSLAETCAARLNMTVDEYRAKVAIKDWTFAWPEALKVGAIDGIIDVKDVPPVYELEPVQPLFRLFGFRTTKAP